MKPYLILIIYFSMSSINGMQPTIPNKKHWDITYYSTKIHLVKESLFEVSEKANIIVVGKHEQDLFSNFDENYHITGTAYFPEPVIYQKKFLNEKSCNDNTYKPYDPANKEKLPCECKRLDNHLIVKIVEPCWAHTDSNYLMPYLLCECYENALESGSLHYGLYNLKEKNIALPTFSVDVGFPRDKAAPLAIKSVLKLVRKTPDKKYNNIYFVIEKNSDFALYKLLLLQHCGLLHNICLFYWGHKDNGNILALLPKELRNYIVELI